MMVIPVSSGKQQQQTDGLPPISKVYFILINTNTCSLFYK